ncbi:MAG: isoaspartyl peptidase/L-asparaginase [bacterium]|nr:isoaspartyl peptidase/L-asparaginase [bacterium]
MSPALVIHGGAWNMPDGDVAAASDAARAALEAGWAALTDGKSALNAVELVVRMMEDESVFDAGVGSHLNSDGKVEMDASIMEGTRLEAGAVAAIQGVRHPVSVARAVMQRSKHVMLVGDGARDFAVEAGAELCRTEDLLIGRERERFERVRSGEDHLVDNEFDPGHEEEDESQSMGTVGAVALDRKGCIVGATSTGGTQDKAPGRVGDTPIIGAGTYADDRVGAVSSTGWGEGILRVTLAKTAVDLMAGGLPPTVAGEGALSTLDRVGAKGGLVLVDRFGRVGAVFNTPRMTRGWATKNGLGVAVDRR